MKFRVALAISVIMTSWFHRVEAAVPEKTSALQGWEGVTVVYGNRGEGTCDLKFPDDFGLKNHEQFQALLTIIRKPIQHDLECMAPPVYYALDHLLNLAVIKQEPRAAQIILRPEFYGGLGLDGELAEGHTLDRKLPVLLRFRGMNKLMIIDPDIGNKVIDEVVYDLCSEWGYNPDLISHTFTGLQKNGLEQLAVKFKKDCDSAVENNPDLQRMFRKQ
jgi:hypothetical protein